MIRFIRFHPPPKDTTLYRFPDKRSTLFRTLLQTGDTFTEGEYFQFTGMKFVFLCRFS
jgi:hypothetical protein